jgi:hypothetical protein
MSLEMGIAAVTFSSIVVQIVVTVYAIRKLRKNNKEPK